LIIGTYYDGKSSKANKVEVRFGLTILKVVGLEESLEVPLESLRVSEALGKTARTIEFKDGARLDLPNVPELDRLTTKNPFYFAHFLERRWSYALMAVALVIGISWALIVFAIPLGARYVANITPVSLDEAIGEQGLALLDSNALSSTELDTEQQKILMQTFEAISQYAADDHQLRLLFRSGGTIGPNALALPSGIIIITDELVDLAENAGEIAGVLAHEVGHVVNNHSMRLLLQSSATAILVVTFTGDFTSLSGLAASIPTVLIQTSYSRNFEREADNYAYEYLNYSGIAASRFGDILKRLETTNTDGQTREILNYLSTHPTTAERSARMND